MRLAAGAPSHTAHARSGPQSRHGARPQPREQGARLKAWAGASDAETGPAPWHTGSGTRTRARTRGHTHAGTHTGARTHRQEHAGTRTRARPRQHTHVDTNTQAHRHAHADSHTRARTHAGTHTGHTHAGTHTCGHAYTRRHTRARTHQAAPTGTHTLSCMGYQPPSDSLQLGPSAPSSAFKPTALHKSGMKQSTTLSEPEQVCSRGRFCG